MSEYDTWTSEKNEKYIDYLGYVENKPLDDEEILERMNIETIEKFLRKKKLKNLTKEE